MPIEKITEVFPNPTVKKVIFQVRFPNLFFMETKIPDIQFKIMQQFTDSSLLLRRAVFFADTGEGGKVEELPNIPQEQSSKKIWQFSSPKKYELNITSNSLDISSEHHKTYRLDGADKFRDCIQFVLDAFFEIVPVPIINRIGLRYIDECPVFSKENESFKTYYNTGFPLHRFNLTDINKMQFRAEIQKGEFFLNYGEKLIEREGRNILILDFDGSVINVKVTDYLIVTDKLHEIVRAEYENSINEPVRQYMLNRETRS
ncbi:MAG: TIGR04255 family protein [Candidatus Xenobiia bacterium LiM19]